LGFCGVFIPYRIAATGELIDADARPRPMGLRFFLLRIPGDDVDVAFTLDDRARKPPAEDASQFCANSEAETIPAAVMNPSTKAERTVFITRASGKRSS
jgi:hypothetical protein